MGLDQHDGDDDGGGDADGDRQARGGRGRGGGRGVRGGRTGPKPKPQKSSTLEDCFVYAGYVGD